MQMDTIGFIGSGNMAEALIKGIISTKVYAPADVSISDIRAERLKFLAKKYNVVPVRDNAELAARVETLVLSIKPQNMADALKSIAGAVKKDCLVISIVAGKRADGIAAVLGDVAIVRVMPNTPALIGQGASALFANRKAKPMLKKAMRIFSSVGKAVVVDNEDLLDTVTAISGSGPAYYFLLMEEMIKAGVEMGLSEEIAKELVLQTARGAGMLAVEAAKNNEGPAILRQKVTSPGGTTEAALKILAEGKFGPLIAAAVKKAKERSRQLSEGS
jgi:pyrroline-5-carboxylate reductase